MNKEIRDPRHGLPVHPAIFHDPPHPVIRKSAEELFHVSLKGPWKALDLPYNLGYSGCGGDAYGFHVPNVYRTAQLSIKVEEPWFE